MSDKSSPSRYALSFTTGALLMREAIVVAPLYLQERDWTKVRVRIMEDNPLQSRTIQSRRLFARETTDRLGVLSDAEIELLLDSTATERGHLLWAAACRRYDLIGEFAEEILREHFLLLVTSLDYADFDVFIRTKSLWHEEIANLKDSTLRRLRSNVFQMLAEAGLHSKGGHIEQAVLSARVVDTLSARTPSDVRFFPTGVSLLWPART